MYYWLLKNRVGLLISSQAGYLSLHGTGRLRKHQLALLACCRIVAAPKKGQNLVLLQYGAISFVHPSCYARDFALPFPRRSCSHKARIGGTKFTRRQVA